MKCKLCEKEIEGYGNWLSKGGYRCDTCNSRYYFQPIMKGVHL